MPLNATTLGSAIATKVTALSQADKENPTKIWTAVAEEIINHIKTQSQITVSVASVSGVTAGPAVSGPGTGTGTIT